jgi:Xaa-Pro aminopeptidase
MPLSSEKMTSGKIDTATLGQAPSREIFQARHDRLRTILDDRQLDALVIVSLPNLTYISGFSGSAGLLVVTRGRLYLLIDFRYSAAVARAAAAGALAPALDPVRVEGSYDRQLAIWLATASAQRGVRRVGFESAHVSVSRFDTWRHEIGLQLGEVDDREAADAGSAGSGPIEWVPVAGAVEEGRLRKDIWEQAILREAASRLSGVTRTVLADLVRPGRTEAEIAADIDWRLRHAGFSKTAFDTIVAAGPNSALPHAVPTSRPLARGDLVLLDFGGVYGGYCVDLTRTVGLAPVPQACRDLYEAVHEAHAAAVDAAGRVGVTTGEVDAAARDTLTARGLGEHFGHGTGHGLGLEVHEAPRLSRRTVEHPGDTPIEPGMVFTIEPGAYVTDLGGVRLEDDVLVTPDGCAMLTDVPRDWREW